MDMLVLLLSHLLALVCVGWEVLDRMWNGRVSRINGHCPRRWISWLFKNHHLHGSKNNSGTGNLIMHMVIIVWGIKWQECVLCLFGYWLPHSWPPGSPRRSLLLFPCQSTKGFCFKNGGGGGGVRPPWCFTNYLPSPTYPQASHPSLANMRR